MIVSSIVTFMPFRRVYRSPFVWLDLLTIMPLYLRMFLYADTMTAATYLEKQGYTIRIIEVPSRLEAEASAAGGCGCRCRRLLLMLLLVVCRLHCDVAGVRCLPHPQALPLL